MGLSPDLSSGQNFSYVVTPLRGEVLRVTPRALLLSVVPSLSGTRLPGLPNEAVPSLRGPATDVTRAPTPGVWRRQRHSWKWTRVWERVRWTLLSLVPCREKVKEFRGKGDRGWYGLRV